MLGCGSHSTSPHIHSLCDPGRIQNTHNRITMKPMKICTSGYQTIVVEFRDVEWHIWGSTYDLHDNWSHFDIFGTWCRLQRITRRLWISDKLHVYTIHHPWHTWQTKHTTFEEPCVKRQNSITFWIVFNYCYGSCPRCVGKTLACKSMRN